VGEGSVKSRRTKRTVSFYKNRGGEVEDAHEEGGVRHGVTDVITEPWGRGNARGARGELVMKG
jgi:hypothetical protein